MRQTGTIASLVCASIVATTPIDSPATESTFETPNILFIMSDDHASQAIGAYGGRLENLNVTPNLDGLAQEGVLFENCFVVNSICTPSRSTLFTGKYSHINGVYKFTALDQKNQPILPVQMQEAGYHTAFFGKYHLHSNPVGFDYYEVLPGQGDYHNPRFVKKGDQSESGWVRDGKKTRYTGHSSDTIGDLTIQHLQESLPEDRPFMLFCHFKAPHDTWEYARRYEDLYADIEIPEPKNLFDDFDGRADALRTQLQYIGSDWGNHTNFKEQTKGLTGTALRKKQYQLYMQKYLRCVKGVDYNIGRILAYLKESGLEKNTVVIYTSDQGFYLGEHGMYDKRFMYEEALRSPFIARWPGVIEPGTRSEGMILNLDFASTLLEIASGQDIPEAQGRSFVPLLKGDVPDDWRTSMYYRYYFSHFQTEPHWGVRTMTHKLIYFNRINQWELYDLTQDPTEMNNLYNDPAQAKTIGALKEEISRLQAYYDDDPNDIGDHPRTGFEEREEEEADEGGLKPIEFEDVPTSIRNKAREEYPDEPLMAVEMSKEDGQVIYHIMFEVDGAEVGLKIDSKGKVIDRWNFGNEDQTEANFPPTHSNIEYGPHDRNKLDLWLAESENPTPLLICIHGGGFSGGDKRGFHGEVELLGPTLEAGISVAAINYRLTEGGKNPFPIPMHDGARSVQFLRHHAETYNLDKNRFAATGGSAGGCMLMWLGFHPDLSNPDDNDPVARESTRLQALAPFGGQSSLHIPTLEKWFNVGSLKIHPAYPPLFAIGDENIPIKMTDRFDTAMRDASPITYLSSDDPPIYLLYRDDNVLVTEESSPGVWVHHPIMGTKLKEAMDTLGLECHVEYPGSDPIEEYASQVDFIIRKLTEK